MPPDSYRPLGIARQKGKSIDIVRLNNILYGCNHNIIQQLSYKINCGVSGHRHWERELVMTCYGVGR
jgi:hypothetical protein